MNKNVKIIIGAIAVLFIAYVIYNVYNTAKDGTESFGNFDTNSTANKHIKVELLKEKGITPSAGGGASFFVKDRAGIIKKVTIEKELPPGFENAVNITLMGHLHGDYFHATEITLE
ncbi:MAG TPA: hypothetical protein PK605_08420 [Ignavibacteria bacterium]|nr:hypothetical protein [Ignavibacteria bacterium]HAX48033.1 hypothetical protein [Bacteroidota bacterium]HRE10698.1 hypothetical protein [Ignavibacteria bacterium]HRF66770.1 hypothetical protein [Ignavibacteria bacterium]HRJ04412.1 hypothetical protein [Ignavibacteria bacterium]